MGIFMVTDGLGNDQISFIRRFYNDGENVNCGAHRVPFEDDNGILTWHVVYYTRRDIKPHEELTVSYGGDYWDARDVSKSP